MAEIGLAVVQTLFAALNCSELKHICAVWGYKSKLEDLNKTVATINNVLLDAESKSLTNEAQGYIHELKDALYEADDLFDEFVTLLELNQLQKSPSKRAEFFQKVRRFFSSDKNQVSHAFRMFHGVKKIQKKLNVIVDNHKKFSLGVDFQPIIVRREETYSYVDVNGIIGRDSDKNYIIDKLLESKDQHVQFFTIVGVGGLGKTALAQLVYNDEKLKKEFGETMFWVCVSDGDKTHFELKDVLCKIVESVTHQKSFDACSLQSVQEEFQRYFKRKKYFLVLDDIWNEHRENWMGLESLLMLGQGGSRVLVTTRSEITATIIGDGWTYNLQGLSPNNSWNLFEMTAFNKGNNRQFVNHNEMVEIGKKIVEKCSNIPLAIKVIGSLLFRQDIRKWRSFEKSGLTNIDGDKKIMAILKFSYQNLTSSLKSCFVYCAMFPKDFEIKKGFLVNLWIAQGYIERLNGGQSIEDAAEEHFNILLQRCFFQDVKKDEYDEIESVKIHDLMHDVAQQVGGEEVKVLSSVDNTLGDRTRHINIIDRNCVIRVGDWSNNLRTLLTEDYFSMLSDIKLGNWNSLRALKLEHLNRGVRFLNSVAELQHLRYLDVSWGKFEELPNSITKLHNLHTLILKGCSYLRQLPHDFCKLVKLSHLNLDECRKLTDMPLGLNKLKDFGALINVSGRICIEIGSKYGVEDEEMDMSGGEYLSKIPDLKEVLIHDKYFGAEAIKEALLEKLEPHPNLKKLELISYGGMIIPWWRRTHDKFATIKLSNLVIIKFKYCRTLVYLPSLSKLPFLKSLELDYLDNLEYMEIRSSLRESSDDTTFFPSLVLLDIRWCLKWKGWLREEGMGDAAYGCSGILSFPRLSEVSIDHCPSLMSFPHCPTVKSIKFEDMNKTSRLMKKMMGKEEEQGGDKKIGNHTASSSLSSSSSSCLATLEIKNDKELESLSEFEKVFETCASSLRRLQIQRCYNLSRLSRGLEHLTALENLYLEDCGLKLLEDNDNEEIMVWIPLHQSLHSVTFKGIYHMTSLPKGMQYLTSLQTLMLEDCKNLKGLPEWISSLSSLRTLNIGRCEAIESLPEGIQDLTSLQSLTICTCYDHPVLLRERCREPDGQDWPKIQHIPNIKQTKYWIDDPRMSR